MASHGGFQRTLSIVRIKARNILQKTQFFPFKNPSSPTCDVHVGPVCFITTAQAMSIRVVFMWSTINDIQYVQPNRFKTSHIYHWQK